MGCILQKEGNIIVSPSYRKLLLVIEICTKMVRLQIIPIDRKICFVTVNKNQFFCVMTVEKHGVLQRTGCIVQKQEYITVSRLYYKGF